MIPFQSFFSQLCRGKNTLRRAKRALAPTMRGVFRIAACDKREYLDCEMCFAID